MCDFSGRLIAWLDRELPEDETAEVERHLHSCAECRSRVNTYAKVGAAFDEYCEAAVTSRVRRKLPRWAPVVPAAVAAAAAVLLLAFARARVERLPPSSLAAEAPPAVVLAASAVPVKPSSIEKVRRRRAVGPDLQAVRAAAQIQTVKWLLPEPAIQIAIPAEAMFPPGAVPEGITFIADVSIAADGSARQLRLRP